MASHPKTHIGAFESVLMFQCQLIYGFRNGTSLGKNDYFEPVFNKFESRIPCLLAANSGDIHVCGNQTRNLENFQYFYVNFFRVIYCSVSV